MLIPHLIEGYLERKRFEAKIIVAEIGRALSGNKTPAGNSKATEWVHPDQFLKRTQ